MGSGGGRLRVAAATSLIVAVLFGVATLGALRWQDGPVDEPQHLPGAVLAIPSFGAAGFGLAALLLVVAARRVD